MYKQYLPQKKDEIKYKFERLVEVGGGGGGRSKEEEEESVGILPNFLVQLGLD